MLTKKEVIDAYQLILGREPESEAVLDYMTNESSLISLGEKLIASREFKRRAAYGNLGKSENQWVCAEIRNDLKIWVDLLDAGVAAGVLQDNWEEDETNFILSVLKEGDHFIDAGANVGWFTILAAHAVGPTGFVWAFEPRIDLKERLEQSVEANSFCDRVAVNSVALGEHAGHLDLAVMPAERNPGHSFLIPKGLPAGAKNLGTVKVEPLDSFQFNEPIRLIKIDVEGAEGLILKGAKQILERDHPIIVSEIFPRWLNAVSNFTPSDYLKILKDHGYRLFYLSQGGIGREIHSFGAAAFSDSTYFNTVALSQKDASNLLQYKFDDRLSSMEAALAASASALEHALSKQTTSEEVFLLSKVINDLEEKCKATSISTENQLAEAKNNLVDVQFKLDETEVKLEEAQVKLEATEVKLKEAQVKLEATEVKLEEAQIKLEETAERLVASEKISRQYQLALTTLKQENELNLGARAWALAQLQDQLEAIRTSTSWRMTQPVRQIGEKLPIGVRQNIARAARVTWWSLNLQLRQKLRERNTRISTQPSLSPTNSSSPNRASFSSSHAIDRPIAFIVDDRWPQPDRDGGSIDAINLIETLLKFGFYVIFAADRAFDAVGPDRDRVASLGAHCLGLNDSSSVQDFIEKHGLELSLIVLTRFNAGGQYLELARHHCHDAKIVFNTVDLHFLREEREALLFNNEEALLNAQKTRAREEFLVAQCDATIVVSAAERALLTETIPNAFILELPLSRDGIETPSAFSSRSGIGFIGGFAHTPNVDAVRYFLKEIWPLVIAKLPSCTFSIVGTGLPDDVISGSKNVEYIGYLQNINPWFDSLKMSVAPLRYGAGMKGKVVSSLAAGLPCIGTSVAIEGMLVVPGEHLLVADDPESFAAAIISLYGDESRWTSLSVAGRIYAEEENSIKAYRRRLHEMLICIGLPCITPN